MKKILLTLLLSMSILHANFFKEEDKQLHIAFSVPLGMLGASMCNRYFDLNGLPMVLCGTAIGMIPGIAKEALDEHNYGGWDNRDLGADAIGAFIGSVGTFTIYKFNSGR